MFLRFAQSLKVENVWFCEQINRIISVREYQFFSYEIITLVNIIKILIHG